MTRKTVRSRRRAERGGGLLDLAVDLLQHRLNGAHDEGQADEDQRDDDAERREGDLEPEACRDRADPAIRRIDRGERDAGDRGRQREGQIDHRIDDAPAREIGSAPAPRRRSTPKTTLISAAIERRRRRKGAAPPACAASVAIAQNSGRSDAGRPQHEGGKRDQHDQAEGKST